jgi:hypothetical protein
MASCHSPSIGICINSLTEKAEGVVFYVWYLHVSTGHMHRKAGGRHLSLSTGSVIISASSGWPMSCQNPPVSTPNCASRPMQPCLVLFKMLGILTQVLMLPKQALLPTELSPLSQQNFFEHLLHIRHFFVPNHQEYNSD